jgi:superfamily II DNA helicase RecQ
MLLHLRTPRSDPNARLESLLGRRIKARQQRAADVLRFVQSGRCRHALLAEYSGAPAAERCNWCDNCGIALTSLLARK